jgi:cysteine synthase/biotin carboxylase
VRFDGVVEAVGHTPLVRLRIDGAPGVEAYAKLELQNLFAMKDRVARQVLLSARRSGELAPGAPIVESSSGTMALGLALVGTALGHDVHIVTDPRIDPITLAKLEALGCVVHVVEAMTGQGWQSARLELLARLMAKLPGAYCPRQYTNPQNPAAYRGLAEELGNELGRVDVLVGAVGSGGSLCGTAKVLLEGLPDLRVVAVDCVGSVLFAQPDRPTRRQSGLGNSLQPENVDYQLIDEIHWLSDEEAFAAARALAREQKLFAGNTSGSVYRVLRHLAERATPGARLVGIFPDRGDRYVGSVYTGELGQVSTEPRRVDYGTEVTSWSYALLGAGRPKLAFVESNTTGTGMLALRTAARLGTEPALLTSKPSRYAGLEGTRSRVIECDTNDLDALRAALDELGGPLAGVATTSEFYTVAAARVATERGLPTNPPEALARCRDKSLTRAALASAGIRQPAFVPVRDAAAVTAAVAQVGLPCVVKPADDSGSQDVLLCADPIAAAVQVERILAVTTNVRDQPTAGTALVEEYVDTPEVSVEMFGIGGEQVCLGITRKTVTGLPHFIESGHLFPADLPAEVAAEVTATVRAALAATLLVLAASHTEVKLTPTGASVIEINGRAAGGMIPELMRLAIGVDLLEQQLRAAAGLPVDLTPSRRRVAGIRFLLADCDGVLEGVTGVDAALAMPGIDRVAVTAAPGARVRRPRTAYDRLGHIIAVGATHAEVDRLLDTAIDLVTPSIVDRVSA